MRPDQLEHERRLQQAEVGQHVEHPEVAQFGPHRTVEGRALPGREGVQGEPVLEEPGHGLLQLDLLGVQAELHKHLEVILSS